MFFKIFFITFVLHVANAAMDPACSAPLETDPTTCCKLPKYIQMEDSEMQKKCGKFLSDKSDKLDLFSKELRCYSDCLSKESGVLKNGELQADVLKKLVGDNIKDQKDWMPIVMEAANACINIANATPNPAEVPEDECLPISSTFYGCIQTQSFKNCPASAWTASEPCNKIKQLAEKCPVISAAL